MKKEDIQYTHIILQSATGYKWESEYRFHDTRKWRFDFALPEKKIAIEIEGGIYMKKSRHTSSTGYIKDMEKYNHAVMAGYKLLRYKDTKDLFNSIEQVKELCKG